MPNIKSAKKRMRTSENAHARNRAAKSRLTTFRQQVYEAAEAGDRGKAESAYRTYCSALDKAARHGAIKKNNANRRKSRAARKLAELA
jgi:small subunit ribosomal protein S20